jgi:hypothetical protein
MRCGPLQGGTQLVHGPHFDEVFGTRSDTEGCKGAQVDVGEDGHA